MGSEHCHTPVAAGRGRDLAITPVAALSRGMEDVTVCGWIRRAGRRVLPGGDAVIEGHLRDESGDVPFSAWMECSFSVGDRVAIRGARTGSWQGRLQLELDADSEITRIEDGSEPEPPGIVPLSELSAGDRAVEISATVVHAETTTVEGDDGPLRVRRGTLGDGVVRLPAIDWTGRARLIRGARVWIANAFVATYRGIRSVNLTRWSEIETGDTSAPSAPTLPRRSIREARRLGSSHDVHVAGAILGTLAGSGLIARCPDCGRTLGGTRCRRHGPVEPTPDLRVKAILDDGSDSVTLILGTDMTASIYGAGVEEARKEAQGTMADPVSDRIDRALVGRSFRVHGRLSVDANGARLTAETMDPIDPSPRHRAQRALEELRR